MSLPSGSRIGMPERSRRGSPETLPALEPPCDSAAEGRNPRTSRPVGPSRDALTKLPVTSETEDATERAEMPPVSMSNGLENGRANERSRRRGSEEAKMSKSSPAPSSLGSADTSDGATEEASSRAAAAREPAALPPREGADIRSEAEDEVPRSGSEVYGDASVTSACSRISSPRRTRSTSARIVRPDSTRRTRIGGRPSSRPSSSSSARETARFPCTYSTSSSLAPSSSLCNSEPSPSSEQPAAASHAD